MALHLFAGVRVRDLRTAQPWYERLLGAPSFFPNDSEAVWTLADERSIYIVEHAEGAGSSAVTVFLDDLDAHLTAVAGRGLEPDDIETYSNGVRKAVFHDPDGNEVGFGGAPPETDA
jgi:catechol 2,3-dioxygenase-like lactoylglutathione lyase family enzyme